ncbi:MAG: glutamate racemase [Thermodesulfobacteriota bacterium]
MIGIFDSGIGGLTVVKAIMEQLPEYDLVYFGDTARTPYGSKSGDTVAGYAVENTDFLLGQGARIIVVACNSASSVAMDRLHGSYDGPIFEVITPAVETAVAASSTRRIGVIGTRATVNSGIYPREIQKAAPGAAVFSAACPLLVPLVEEGWLKKPETRMIVKKYLLPLKVRQIDTLILGCTHYPLLKPIIQTKIGKRVKIIDSSIAVAAKVRQFMATHPEIAAGMKKNGASRFFVSDVTSQFEKIARLLLKRDINLTHVAI